ncbi:hypothetical protein ACFFRR_010674 [Megaselia abdita]
MENLAYVSDGNDGIKLDNIKSNRKSFNYNEALEATQTGNFHLLLLLVCGLGYMAASVEIIGVSVVMFSADCDLRLTVQQQGLLGSIGYFGVVLSSHAMGFSADTWGRVKTIRLSLLFSVCVSLASVFSINTTMLLVCRFFTGFFISASQSCVYTLLGEYHSSKTRMNHITVLASFLVIGLIYIQGMAVLLLPLKLTFLSPWRLILLVNTFPSICCSIGFFFIPESPKYFLDQGRQEDCIKVLQKVYSLNTGNPKDTYPCNSIVFHEAEDRMFGITEKLKLMSRQTITIFNREHILQTLKFSFVAFLISMIGAGLYMWLPPVLNYMVTYEGEKHTVCDVVKLVKVKSSNLTYEEKCSVEKDLTHFKIFFFINVAYFVFFVMTAVLTTVVGKRLKTSFGRHILKTSVLGFLISFSFIS